MLRLQTVQEVCRAYAEARQRFEEERRWIERGGPDDEQPRRRGTPHRDRLGGAYDPGGAPTKAPPERKMVGT